MKKTQIVVKTFLLSVLLCGAVAQADVTVKAKLLSTGSMGPGAMNGSQTFMFKPDRSKMVMVLDLPEEIKQQMPADGTGQLVTITRLDKQVNWMIMPGQPSYMELPFVQLKQMYGIAADSTKPAPALPGVPTIEVKKTSETKTILGYPSQKYLISLQQKMGKMSDTLAPAILVTIEMWNSDKIPGYSEIEIFGKKMSELLGLDPKIYSLLATGLVPLGADFDPEAVSHKIGELTGYPLVTNITIRQLGGGPPDWQTAMSELSQKKTRKKSVADQGRLIMNLRLEVTAISTSTINNKEFELPEGLTKTELPVLPQFDEGR